MGSEYAMHSAIPQLRLMEHALTLIAEPARMFDCLETLLWRRHADMYKPEKALGQK